METSSWELQCAIEKLLTSTEDQSTTLTISSLSNLAWPSTNPQKSCKGTNINMNPQWSSWTHTSALSKLSSLLADKLMPHHNSLSLLSMFSSLNTLNLSMRRSNMSTLLNSLKCLQDTCWLSSHSNNLFTTTFLSRRLLRSTLDNQRTLQLAMAKETRSLLLLKELSIDKVDRKILTESSYSWNKIKRLLTALLNDYWCKSIIIQ